MPQEAAWNAFVQRVQAEGATTELQEELAQLLESGNPYAKRAQERMRALEPTGHKSGKALWEQGELLRWVRTFGAHTTL